jgi:hypothetical protein
MASCHLPRVLDAGSAPEPSRRGIRKRTCEPPCLARTFRKISPRFRTGIVGRGFADDRAGRPGSGSRGRPWFHVDPLHSPRRSNPASGTNSRTTERGREGVSLWEAPRGSASPDFTRHRRRGASRSSLSIECPVPGRRAAGGRAPAGDVVIRVAHDHDALSAFPEAGMPLKSMPMWLP